VEYQGELAAVQQELARSSDMAARRVRVLDALGANPGQRVVEVGCCCGRSGGWWAGAASCPPGRSRSSSWEVVTAWVGRA